jgi:hypothetical protein
MLRFAPCAFDVDPCVDDALGGEVVLPAGVVLVCAATVVTTNSAAVAHRARELVLM